jgi:hypothetical protein
MKAAEIAAALERSKLEVLRHLLPGGRVRGHEFCVGSLRGEAGESLKVNVNGKSCCWKDFARPGEPGGADLLDLWAAVRRCDIKTAMREAADWLGIGGAGVNYRQGGNSAAPRDEQPTPHPKLGAPAMLFSYYTAAGELIGHVARFNQADGGKEFRPCIWRNGRWDWSGGFAKPRPLYRLPDLAANPDAPVVLVEGEKAVDAALAAHGLLATTWPGGTAGVEHADFSPLRGRDVVLWPDADEPGRKAMVAAARMLTPIARSVRMIELPVDTPAKWDLADSLPATWSEDAIERLIGEARPLANAPTAEDGLGEWDAGEDDYQISPRGWLLGVTFCRGFVSSLLADGGVGKTALRHTQLLSLATGRSLTGEHVFVRCRVLIVSLEDDRDELRRRIWAAMLHHKVSPDEVRGWLYLAAVGGTGWKVATVDENGTVIASALAQKLVATIERLCIDVVTLDPFVKAHACEENSNQQLDAVTSILAGIAATHNCAVDVPHHTSKGTADPGNANRGRGASSFKDAGRLVYTLTQMTVDEAALFGVSEAERRRSVRMDSGKVNIALSAEAKWFRLVSVPLCNGTTTYPNGDEVQTVEPWIPPSTWKGLSNPLLNLILDRIAAGMPNGERYSAAGAAGKRAVWQVFAELVPDRTDKQAREIVNAWLKSGLLYEEEYKSRGQRRPRLGLKVCDAKRPS